MSNLPIYRAEKIDSDELIEGQLTKLYIPDIEIISEEEQADIQRWAYFIVDDISMLDVGCSFTYCGENRFNFKVSEKSEIDPTTLAIHLPDTNIKDLFFGIDSKKGASIVEALFIEDNTLFKGVAMHTHYGYGFYDKNDDWVHISKLWNIKVIGIQK